MKVLTSFLGKCSVFKLYCRCTEAGYCNTGKTSLVFGGGMGSGNNPGATVEVIGILLP